MPFGLISDLVDRACDEFELAWKSGTAPRIEQFLLERGNPEFGALLLELALLELEYRRREGEHPDFQEYARRFPNDLLVLAELDLGPFRLSVDVPSAAIPKLSTYQVTERIGAGAFGTVWKAWDGQLERAVALKVPRFGRLDPEDELHRFLLEAQAAARLNHPNIVSVYNVGHDQQTIFVAMEYVDGENLEQWLKSNSSTLDASAQLCVTLARAVSHAHQNGIIHRDLKPANVMIDACGQPHITDFGLAKHLTKPSSTLSSQQVLGTVAYMSPEQAAGKSKDVSPASDVYSLGVMLYELITGELPFSGNQQTVLHSVLTKAPRRPRTIRKAIPIQLETICLKAISREPARRYLTADDFADDLERFRAGSRIKAKRPNLFTRWRRDQPTKVMLYTTSTGILIAVVTVLLGLVTVPDDGKWHVRVKTTPPGARVMIYPRHPVTRIPQSSSGIRSTSVTPLTLRLPPGEYLVVVYIEGTSRFHEVDRLVPPLDVTVSGGSTNNVYWKPVGARTLEWMTIAIPQPDVTSKMTRLQGSSHFRACTPIDLGTYRVPDFFIAPSEFSVADFLSLRGATLGANDPIWKQDPTLPYIPRGRDIAIHWAERAGGRLPNEVEFDFASMQITPTIEQSEVTGASAVQRTLPDGLLAPSTIVGLAPRGIEWADSEPYEFDAQGEITRQLADPRRYGIARGGIPSTNLSTDEIRDPPSRHIVKKQGPQSNLAFRLVRSSAPRLKPDDFVQNLATPTQK